MVAFALVSQSSKLERSIEYAAVNVREQMHKLIGIVDAALEAKDLKWHGKHMQIPEKPPSRARRDQNLQIRTMIFRSSGCCPRCNSRRSESS